MSKKCPYCAEEIQDEAIKCKYCQSILQDTNSNNIMTKQTATQREAEIIKNGGCSLLAYIIFIGTCCLVVRWIVIFFCEFFWD